MSNDKRGRGRPKKYGEPTSAVDPGRMLLLAQQILQLDGEIADRRADRFELDKAATKLDQQLDLTDRLKVVA